jgi:hypothetical protein
MHSLLLCNILFALTLWTGGLLLGSLGLEATLNPQTHRRASWTSIPSQSNLRPDRPLTTGKHAVNGRLKTTLDPFNSLISPEIASIDPAMVTSIRPRSTRVTSKYPVLQAGIDDPALSPLTTTCKRRAKTTTTVESTTTTVKPPTTEEASNLTPISYDCDGNPSCGIRQKFRQHCDLAVKRLRNHIVYGYVSYPSPHFCSKKTHLTNRIEQQTIMAIPEPVVQMTRHLAWVVVSLSRETDVK